MTQIATTIEQSKYLLELGLEPKTADCNWNTTFGDWSLCIGKNKLPQAVPAWSLSALLEVMPKNAELMKMENDAHELYYEIDYMYTGYEDKDAVTAAYEMVCCLLEQGLIKKGGNQ